VPCGALREAAGRVQPPRRPADVPALADTLEIATACPARGPACAAALEDGGAINAATRGYGVTRTLRALEAPASRPLSGGGLAEQMGVHQRTARRLLISLADEDYSTPLGGQLNRYAITARVAAVGAQALLDGVRREGGAPPARRHREGFAVLAGRVIRERRSRTRRPASDQRIRARRRQPPWQATTASASWLPDPTRALRRRS
jgi:hypothetical protein